MERVEFIYWEEDGVWLGYLQDFPDAWIQGESLEELKDHLRDLHRDLTSGVLPSARR
ncbi:MAG TPA: type II toxin-antitoxin system HicB family antitoxin [Longimicrobium sp.]|nr:type II toxin-antitoxin system HicB family antitoxin [Longimicrobium sp.]